MIRTAAARGRATAIAIAAMTAIGACGGGTAADPSPSATPPTGTNDAPSPTTKPTDSPAPTSTPTTPPPPPPPPKDPPLTATSCFKDLSGTVPGPDYDKFKPVIAKSCAGTHHQTITGVQKLVFLGDSVTVGTPPTAPNDFYRLRLEKKLKAKFGAHLEVTSCANWGAKIDDLLTNDEQLAHCFPGGVENKKTLIVMTNGGNDIHGWAKRKIPTAEALVEVDEAIAKLRSAVEWIKSPTHFPNGSYLVFANVYEYTDTSGDLMSCPAASLAGMSGSWPEGKPAIAHFEEEFMHVAVDTQTDMMFLLEHFCGHGYKRNDPGLQCYRGPGAALWFDLTCIHPTPEGHEQIADLFEKIIDGT